MATLDLTDVRPKDDLAAPNGDYLAEDSLSMPAELWAPPLAPFADEDAYLAPQPSRRMLIAGTAIVAALGVETTRGNRGNRANRSRGINRSGIAGAAASYYC